MTRFSTVIERSLKIDHVPKRIEGRLEIHRGEEATNAKLCLTAEDGVSGRFGPG